MKFKGVVYVAGPYNPVSGKTVEENIMAASAVAIELWQHGWVAICPHLNTAHFEKVTRLGSIDFVDGDLLIVKRCDAVVCVPGWTASKGAIREVACAIEHDIPFFVWESVTATISGLDEVVG